MCVGVAASMLLGVVVRVLLLYLCATECWWGGHTTVVVGVLGVRGCALLTGVLLSVVVSALVLCRWSPACYWDTSGCRAALCFSPHDTLYATPAQPLRNTRRNPLRTSVVMWRRRKMELPRTSWEETVEGVSLRLV